MTDFKANAPNSIFGELSVSPDPLAEFGAASWQGEGLGWGRGGKGGGDGKGREGKWRGGKGRAPKLLLNQGPSRALQN